MNWWKGPSFLGDKFLLHILLPVDAYNHVRYLSKAHALLYLNPQDLPPLLPDSPTLSSCNLTQSFSVDGCEEISNMADLIPTMPYFIFSKRTIAMNDIYILDSTYVF